MIPAAARGSGSGAPLPCSTLGAATRYIVTYIATTIFFLACPCAMAHGAPLSESALMSAARPNPSFSYALTSPMSLRPDLLSYTAAARRFRTRCASLPSPPAHSSVEAAERSAAQGGASVDLHNGRV